MIKYIETADRVINIEAISYVRKNEKDENSIILEMNNGHGLKIDLPWATFISDVQGTFTQFKKEII